MENNVNFMKKYSWETRETNEKEHEIRQILSEIPLRARIHGKKWNSWKNVKFIKKKKREIHENNVQFMKKTWNSWKKNVKFMENNVNFMKKCTNTWETRETHEQENEIRQILSEIPLRARIHGKKWNSWKNVKFIKKNVKFMKTTWKSWKKLWNSWKKREIHEKNVEFMEKNVKFMENNVKFMKKTWNSWKKRGKS